jgi:hypothetical protein
MQLLLPTHLTVWFAQDDEEARSVAAVQQYNPPGYMKNCIVLLGKKRFAEADPALKAQIVKIEVFLAKVCAWMIYGYLCLCRDDCRHHHPSVYVCWSIALGTPRLSGCVLPLVCRGVHRMAPPSR